MGVMSKDDIMGLIKNTIGAPNISYYQLWSLRNALEDAVEMVNNVILEKYATVDIGKDIKKNNLNGVLDMDRVVLIMQKNIKPVNDTIRLITSEGKYYLKKVDVDDAKVDECEYGKCIQFRDKYGNYVRIRMEYLEKATRILDALRGEKWTKNSYKKYYYYMHSEAPLLMFDGWDYIAIIAPLVEVDEE